MTVAVPMDLRRRLLQIARNPSLQLEALKPHWGQLKKSIKRRRQKLADCVPKNDPIWFPINLLTPIGCDTDEIRHTQALAYILGEKNSHGLFKRGVLISVIKKIKEVCPRGTREFKIASKTLNMAKTATEIKVTHECKNDIGRCDIWIELHRKTSHGLIIIENKIGAPVRPNQLAGYKSEASKWCKRYHAPPALLVLLAREKPEEEKGWVSLRYLELASALRRSWDQSRPVSNAARAWLGSYIAAIMAGVLKIDDVTDIKRDDLEAYLDRDLPSLEGESLMAKNLSLPAISREFDFYVRNVSTVDEIYDSKVVEPFVQLTKAIYDRAEQDMCVLFDEAQKAFNAGVHGLLRVNTWARSFEQWEVQTSIFMPSGPKKRIGSVGLYIDFGSPVPGLVGWVFPFGGMAGRSELIRACQHIQVGHAQRRVHEIDNSVVWLDKPLTLETSRDELRREIEKRAKSFFKTAKPVLKRFADQK